MLVHLWLLIGLSVFFFCMFFFSSRRRHTISLCDWSSDVCSSDLGQGMKKNCTIAEFLQRSLRFAWSSIRCDRAVFLHSLPVLSGLTNTAMLKDSLCRCRVTSEHRTNQEQGSRKKRTARNRCATGRGL